MDWQKVYIFWGIGVKRLCWKQTDNINDRFSSLASVHNVIVCNRNGFKTKGDYKKCSASTLFTL
jgi:hypothetical protein